MKLILLILFLFFPIHTQDYVSDTDDTWGWHTLIDLEECDPQTINNKPYIERFVKGLCAVIDMKRFGEPIVIHFGCDPRVSGYSLLQLIETSSITGHFSELSNRAFIDIFSCKKYDTDKAIAFTSACFRGKVKNHYRIERK